MANRFRKDEFIFKEPSEQGNEGTKKNWYALAVSILANKSVKGALKAMGLSETTRNTATLGREPPSYEFCYIIHKICGLSDDKANALLGLRGRTVSYKAKRYKQIWEENQWLE